MKRKQKFSIFVELRAKLSARTDIFYIKAFLLYPYTNLN